MDLSSLALSKQDLEALRMRAQAEKERRIREGVWTGSVQPHVNYQKRPLDWIVTYLAVPEHTLRWSMNEGYGSCICDSEVCQGGGEHVWDGDKDPLVGVLEALADWQDVAVESGTGTGKTFVAACIVLWFLACHEDALVVTAAPKKDQLLKQVWQEIGKLWPRFQNHFKKAELLTGQIRMKPDESDKEAWSALAFTAGVGADEDAATKAQGFHRPHMLIITEETPGMPWPILTAFDETRTDDHNLHLALGNPDHRHDPLHQISERPNVTAVRISAFDHPNVVTGERIVPGAIGAKRLGERIDNLGKGSRLYQSRVRGISPAESEEALIRWDWLEAAAKKWGDEQLREGTMALGVDVADNPDGDDSAIAFWQGACLTEVRVLDVEDAGEVAERVYEAMMEYDIHPKQVGLDSVGVGASTKNELKRRFGIKVRYLSGGTRATPTVDIDDLWSKRQEDADGTIKPAGQTVVEAERFNNLRSQVWWRMREDLRLGRIALPNDEALFSDLTAPMWTTKSGVIVVEPKEEIKKRLRRSPDKGDAAVMGNFVRRRRPIIEQKSVFDRDGVDRDLGLEKLLARRAKEKKQRDRQVMRVLRQRARRRR